MVQHFSQGIRITVKTRFRGTFHRNSQPRFAFRYQIVIENESNDAVQLNSRWWRIREILKERDTIFDQTLSGKKRVLQPGETYTYSSGCLLSSPFGFINGHFDMINFTSTRKFKVSIPKFKLSAPYALN